MSSQPTHYSSPGSQVDQAEMREVHPKNNDNAPFPKQADAGYQDREISQGSVAGQFISTVKKNVVLKLRDPVNLFLEFFIPVLFVIGIMGIWFAVPNKDSPGENLLNNEVRPSFPPDITPAANRAFFCHNISQTEYVARATNPHLSSPGLQLCNFSAETNPFNATTMRCFPQTNWELCTTNMGIAVGVLFGFLSLKSKPVPSLDEMIMMMVTGRDIIGPEEQTWDPKFAAVSQYGKVHLVGTNTTWLQDFRYFVGNRSSLWPLIEGQTFETSEQANIHVGSIEEEGLNWGFVSFENLGTNDLSATLHFNKSGIPDTNIIVDRFIGGGLGSQRYLNYFGSGFLTWQVIVNEFFYAQTNRTAPEQPWLAPMPFIDWTNAAFLSGAGTFVPLLVVFSFLYPVSQQTKRLVEEKEKRVREAMMIMGLGAGSFYASHWLTYQLVYLATSLVCSIILKLTVFNKTDFFLQFFLFYFFTLSCISLASLFSSVFSKSRLAALLSPLLFFVVALPYFAVQDASGAIQFFFAFLSPSAFAIGTTLIANYEISTGMGWQDMANSQDTFNMAAVYFFLLFDTVWYFLVALWFDKVLPSEWGTQEHCCFCYLRVSAMCRERRDEEGVENDGKDPNGKYEEDPTGRPSIQIRGLRKEFTRGAETFVAVNDLTLNLYEGQISVILGHNGAGKTTAINLMTGMLAPDGGDCLVYGKSIHTDMRGVRQEIGFCPQHNILWENMTCREHLEYFGKLKGLEGDELEDAVMEMITAVDLLPKLDDVAGSLSGGMKRKLSVAIAFVGRSRVVFLDEPTAGMDVMARRHTWDLIKQKAVGRTIIMTTHYMDEADLLGNQIAIMAKGRLKCKGSSLFLKSRLGVGYTLNCAIAANANIAAIDSAVLENVQGSEVLNKASGEIGYRLPMNQVSVFPAMLRALEGLSESGVRNFGLSVTTLEEVFMKIGHDDEAEEKLHHDQELAAHPELAAEEATQVKIDEEAWHKYGSQESGFVRQFTSLFSKRFANAKRDTRTQVFQIWMPVAVILLAMWLGSLGGPQRTSEALPLNAEMYSRRTGGGRDSGATDGAHTPVQTPYADCPAVFSNASVWNPKVEIRTDIGTTNATAYSLSLQSSFKSHPNLRMTGLFCADSGRGGPHQNWTTPWVVHNSTGLHAAPEGLQQYYETNLRARYSTDINSQVSTKPLDLTSRQKALFDSFATLTIAIFVLIPFTFVPSTFVSFVVKERECHAKHAQLIAGMNPIAYWVSNFVFDTICFCVTNLLAIIIFAIFSRDEYVGGAEEFFGSFILLLFYAFSGITGAYFCSFAFDNHGSAQNVTMLGNFLAGFLLVLAVWFFQFFESTQDVGNALPWVFRVIPSYCLGEGILNMATRELFAAVGTKPGVFDLDVIGWDLIYMGVEVPLFFGITLFLDSPQRAAAANKLLHEPDKLPDQIEDEDEDVRNERTEVEADARQDDLVIVKHLHKRYPNGKIAVKNLSFGVHEGEVFGFLGTNGAGKTTTMSVLCGEQVPTHGHGTVAGFDVVEDSLNARRVVGYCPQFDALLDLLNAEEHLYLYAGLRGIDPANTHDVVESLIHKSGLTPHRHTLSMNMSGGNKRKLSVAISLIGSPKVVVLDEPSAGMDPMARRGLWSVIEAVAAKCSIVLTTHHLEEVEALANRVAIMDMGMLKCIGTLQQLKHKFGSGFEMSIRVSGDDRVEGMKNFMKENLPDAHEKEYRQQKFTYALPGDTRLSETFGLIEGAKADLGVTDYSISQTSLEQVFLRIGAHDEDDVEEAEKKE